MSRLKSLINQKNSGSSPDTEQKQPEKKIGGLFRKLDKTAVVPKEPEPKPPAPVSPPVKTIFDKIDEEHAKIVADRKKGIIPTTKPTPQKEPFSFMEKVVFKVGKKKSLDEIRADRFKGREPRTSLGDVRNVVKPWTIRKYRCSWELPVGLEIEVTEHVGENYMVNIIPGLTLILAASEVDEHTYDG